MGQRIAGGEYLWSAYLAKYAKCGRVNAETVGNSPLLDKCLKLGQLWEYHIPQGQWKENMQESETLQSERILLMVHRTYKWIVKGDGKF